MNRPSNEILEEVEIAAWSDFFKAAGSERSAELKIVVKSSGSYCLTSVGTTDVLALNRVIGFGYQESESKIQEIQKFRPSLPRKDFERSFKPRFGNIQTVQNIEAGTVTDTQGKQHQIKQVQIVKPESTEVRPPDFGSRGSKLKPGLRPFAEALKPLLRAGPVALTKAARQLNQEEGFQEAKGNLSFLQFLKLFPEFKITGSRQQSKIELS